MTHPLFFHTLTELTVHKRESRMVLLKSLQNQVVDIVVHPGTVLNVLEDRQVIELFDLPKLFFMAHKIQSRLHNLSSLNRYLPNIVL
jgi:hypothetical protein